MLKVAVGCDHAALERKRLIMRYLGENGYEPVDFGAHSAESVDYPSIAFPLCEAVARGECDFGILICGSGVGMSICANKVSGIRCALCSEGYTARLTRRHNDSNVLAMGARTIGSEVAKEITGIFLSTEFEGGRHARRISMIADYEQNK